MCQIWIGIKHDNLHYLSVARILRVFVIVSKLLQAIISYIDQIINPYSLPEVPILLTQPSNHKNLNNPICQKYHKNYNIGHNKIKIAIPWFSHSILPNIHQICTQSNRYKYIRKWYKICGIIDTGDWLPMLSKIKIGCLFLHSLASSSLSAASWPNV